MARSIRIVMKNPLSGFYAIYSVTPISFKWFVMIINEYDSGTGGEDCIILKNGATKENNPVMV